MTTQVTQSHWHVTRHSEDDDPLITSDVYFALDYAATELDRMADFEHDGIRCAGENGDFEGAYRAWEKAELYHGLMLAAKHAPDQHGKHRKDRAPHYAGPDSGPDEKGWEHYLQDDNPDSLLYKTALHHVGEISFRSPLSIWECTEPLAQFDHVVHGDDEVYCTAHGGIGGADLLEQVK